MQLEQPADRQTPAIPAAAPREGEWASTGSYYGAGKVRERPYYPGLGEDAEGRSSTKLRPEADAEEPSCGKFYASYGKRGLTGGVMALWCTHGVCYGWHVIPVAEGRNDVFSALFTRFDRAPRVIIYDFACALAPYCMAREPHFFRNTLFLIDEMHMHDHTKCSAACFFTTYLSENVDLRRIKSSIAECGNSGLKRIRKSVSYPPSPSASPSLGSS